MSTYTPDCVRICFFHSPASLWSLASNSRLPAYQVNLPIRDVCLLLHHTWRLSTSTLLSPISLLDCLSSFAYHNASARERFRSISAVIPSPLWPPISQTCNLPYPSGIHNHSQCTTHHCLLECTLPPDASCIHARPPSTAEIVLAPSRTGPKSITAICNTHIH